MHLVAWENVTKPKKEGGLGIRSMRQSNSAFMAKLGWRVLSEPQSLWSRVLRAKYCDNRCDIDMFKDKTNASNAWRGILSSVDVIRKGLNMAVGNGSKTFFWHHRWATKEPLLTLTSREPPLNIQDMTVKELWDPNIGWRTELFAEYLPDSVLQEIVSHELVEDEEAIDEIYWNGSPSGGFTISSALNIIRNVEETEDDQSKKWALIWKAPVPQRVRLFMWLLIQDRLMTNGNRFIRTLTDDPRCKICDAVEETSEHIVRGCPAAIVVWQKLGFDARNITNDMSFEE